MSKPATLSDEAYQALQSAKEHPSESLSEVILRHVPKPIKTCGDLEEYLEQHDGPLIPDLQALRRVQQRKTKLRRAV
jgi:predicted CopG family antitoxin